MRHQHYKNYYSKARQLRKTSQRSCLLKRAIERTTGIPMKMLIAIEGAMDQRKNHPHLQEFIQKESMPSSTKIISRLLSAPIQKKADRKTENLFTEYRVSLRTSKGQVEIIAAMRLFRKKHWFGNPQSKGIITVKYIISKGESIHEYRQDFILSSGKFVKSKHSALNYNKNVPSNWRQKLSPQQLAPAQTLVI